MALLGQNGTLMSTSPFSRMSLISYFVKQLAHVAYISIQSVLLALWSSPKNLATAATPYATSITIVSYSIILYASCLEHVFSIRPSSIITLYLGPSFLLDLLRMRTLFGTEGQQLTSKLYAYAVIIKLIATCLEALPKRNILFWQWKDESPITTTGLFGLALYTWVNPLLWSGYKTKTTLDSLPTLPKKIQQAARPVSLMEKWEISKSIITHLVSIRADLNSCRQGEEERPDVDICEPLQMGYSHHCSTKNSALYLRHF